MKNEPDIVDVEYEAKSITDTNSQSSESPNVAFQCTDEESPIPPPIDAKAQLPTSEYIWLFESPVYLVQKGNAGRVTPEESQVTMILDTLRNNGFRMTVVALGEHAGFPVFRLRGIVASLQRILNLDGQKILSLDRVSDTLELNDDLLRQEFFSHQ